MEKTKKKFVVAMDNYFTLPKVCAMMRECGIGTVGTARFRGTWPPASIRQVNVKDATFNELFWSIDEFGTLVVRWMDNGMVFLISTVHTVMDVAYCLRRRPRVTQLNKGHVNNVWGKLGKVWLWIPRIVDDYNHWMGGVDLADQMIAYYHPDMRCYQNWLPMFIQLLSCIRLNSYIIYSSHYPNKSHKHFLSHKEFSMAIVEHFIIKAKDANFSTSGHARKRKANGETSVNMDNIKKLEARELLTRPAKRNRTRDSNVNRVEPELPAERFEKPEELHVYGRVVDRDAKPGCRFCTYVWKMKRYHNEEVGTWRQEIKRSNFGCLHCNVPLCQFHFNTYHTFQTP